VLKFYGRRHDLFNRYLMYVAQMPTNIVRLTFSSDMTCDRMFSFSITTDDTSGTGTADPSKAHEGPGAQ
jgi:hypothetical protein